MCSIIFSIFWKWIYSSPSRCPTNICPVTEDSIMSADLIEPESALCYKAQTGTWAFISNSTCWYLPHENLLCFWGNSVAAKSDNHLDGLVQSLFSCSIKIIAIVFLKIWYGYNMGGILLLPDIGSPPSIWYLHSTLR